MPPRAGKKKKDTEKSTTRTASKAGPRTVRLPHADDDWVTEQGKLRPGGATAIIVEAVQRYREQADASQRTVLEAVT